MLATFVMVLAMGMTTSAAEITIEGGAEGSEYAAYKLLNATDGGDGKFAYTLNEKYAGALEKVTKKTDEREIVDSISGLNADETRKFADDVYAEVKDLDADYTTTNDKFENVDQGYYLIVETNTPLGNDEDTYSLVMLDTAGNEEIEVTTKEDKPELVKKVKEKNDSTGVVTDWQDGADYDIGDAVPFQLTGTVEAKYDSYATYYYAFHDTLSKGLTFNNDVKVYVDGTEITTGYTVVTEGLADGESFNVVFDDLKVTPAHAGSKIVVEYTATLNDDAVIGQPGNPNTAKLEYSNNPYGDGTGETPEDKVTVFTYKVVANKVDKDGNALAGAGFTLYKYDAEAAEYVAVGEEITGVTEFTFTGLDAGQYKLVETTVPAGYNQADDLEFTVKAEYETESNNPKFTKLVVVDKDGNEITEFTIDLTKGTVSTNIVNLSGVELPSTGGIGTKIFYTIGAILMIGAAVVLITRKRTSQAK